MRHYIALLFFIFAGSALAGSGLNGQSQDFGVMSGDPSSVKAYSDNRGNQGSLTGEKGEITNPLPGTVGMNQFEGTTNSNEQEATKNLLNEIKQTIQRIKGWSKYKKVLVGFHKDLLGLYQSFLNDPVYGIDDFSGQNDISSRDLITKYRAYRLRRDVQMMRKAVNEYGNYIRLFNDAVDQVSYVSYGGCEHIDAIVVLKACYSGHANCMNTYSSAVRIRKLMWNIIYIRNMLRRSGHKVPGLENPDYEPAYAPDIYFNTYFHDIKCKPQQLPTADIPEALKAYLESFRF